MSEPGMRFATAIAFLPLPWLGVGYLNADRFDDAQRALKRALETGESIRDLESIAYARWDLFWLDLLRPDGKSMSAYREAGKELLTIAAKLSDVYLETLTYYLLGAEALQRRSLGRSQAMGRQLGRPGEPHQLSAGTLARPDDVQLCVGRRR